MATKPKKPIAKAKAATRKEKPRKEPVQRPVQKKKPAVKDPPARKVAPKEEPAEENAAAATKAVRIPQLLRGMRDILPSEQRYWRHVVRKMEEIALAYGYERIDTPVLEETSLFVRSVGKQSDVVEKELFTFTDRSGDSVSLRPEGTASVARAYINHGMVNLPQPVKMFYVGSMFRYERPQAGRFREHHQFGLEVLGEGSPVIDAELIMLSHLLYRDIGIKTVAHVNSIGCSNCRQAYLERLTDFYRPRRSRLCEDCRRRLLKNPLRLLDCKEPSCVAAREEVPHIVDYLCEECKNHLTRVLEYLDEMGVPYVLNPHLVRGLDYYTRTVFELMQSDEQSAGQHSLAGGGRYDNLLEQLGGSPTPACGFSIGVERAILQMKALDLQPVSDLQPDVFLAQLGDTARRKALILFESLRNSGIRTSATFSKSALKGQLEAANRLGARYTVIIGQKEVIDGTVLVRDMESGMQEVVDFTKAVAEMRKKLSRM
ncbi:histidine--tRNA ligase [Candidatus Uhrbacteria bacterium]|nr:histidine--tRNA ligase [Candidatus Uhrbacteria bacterium]